MLKFIMIAGLLYMGFRLVSKPKSDEIGSKKDDLLQENDYTDYEELE